MASTTFSQPPAAPLDEAHAASALRALERPVANLRAEIEATTDKPRQARLLSEIGELHERAGDEPGAARDYLGAFNDDPAFREPLEGLVRLLERRRSLKNLGRLIDALVRAAVTPEERVRALTMRAAFLEDVTKDLPAAKASLEEASTVDVPPAESSAVWLSIELLAAKMGDSALRVQALSERAARSTDPTWRALLLLDLARLAATSGDVVRAFALVEEARALEGGATYLAAITGERLAQAARAATDRETAQACAEAYATSLEAQAELLLEATADPERGDALGVPRGVRSRTFMADAWLRAADVRRLSGDLGKAATVLDRALRIVTSDADAGRSLALPAVTTARMRVAELVGDTELAAQLAAQLLAHEADGGVAASLAMRVAQQAVNVGDMVGALAALQTAITRDPACLPARALQLDLLADGSDAGAFASQLEAFAELLPSDEAKGRAFLLAAYVWGAQAGDADGAKAALSQTGMYGVPKATTSRLTRLLASVQGDPAWYEEATRRLLASGGPDDDEQQHLAFELVRARLARGDREGTIKALGDLAALGPDMAWVAAALQAFLPELAGDDAASMRAQAVERLASLEADPERARGLALVAATTAHRSGDLEGARSRVRALVDKEPADVVLAVYLAGLERAAGHHAAAADVLAACATQSSDAELGAVLHLEAAFARWRGGDREAALEAFTRAASSSDAAKLVLAWAARGVDPDAIDSRRRALVAASESGEDEAWIGLERFATEVAASDFPAALAALQRVEDEGDGDLAVAAALGRLVWPEGASTEDDTERVEAALARLGGAGTLPNQIAAAEQLRRVRTDDPGAVVEAARRWFDVGGGVTAGLEWLTATMVTRDLAGESDARRGLAALFVGAASEALEVSAALLEDVRARVDDPYAREPVPLLLGRSEAVRLANLETTPPGATPTRRARVLRALEGALGGDAAMDALALAGWSFLAAGEAREALAIFEEVSEARPDDLATWEGLRTAAEALGDNERHAYAAAALAERCVDRATAAAFAEETGHLLVALDREDEAEAAFERSFAKDPSRGVAFDKLFRRVRARKDGDKLLFLISRRLEHTDDPTELGKLFWEQARVLREKGDQDGALRALENVTMIEPEHVGALALTGEIFIRRGMYEEAATSLSALALIEEAPPKNRVTAGIAAVDLYENKLDRYDLALDVLLALHKAQLSTLPVRERLARAAARTGSWHEATSILEELMQERPEPQGRIEAARLAMAIYRDRLNDPRGMVKAVCTILDESPSDGDAIDALLELDNIDPATKDALLMRARDHVLATLRTQTPEMLIARRLLKIAHGMRDVETEQLALATTIALSGSDPAGDLALTQMIGRKPRAPQFALTPATLAALLAPGDDGPVAQLFMLLGPTLTEAFGPTVAALGVTKKDRIDAKSGLPLRHEIAAWAGAFGVQEFDLYVGGGDTHGVQGVPGEVPALVVGTGVNVPLPAIVRGRLACELLGIVRGTSLLRSRDELMIAAVVAAACNLAEVPLVAAPYPALADVEKSLSKALARKTRKLLPELCRNIAVSGQDARLWTRRALASQGRAMLVASGDLASALGDTLGETPDRVRSVLKNDERALELMQFAYTPLYLELRRALGLEGQA